MSAFEGLSNFFGASLEDMAKRLNYNPANILILQNKEKELRLKFPETYTNLVSCKHNRDRRTVMQYAQDLIASWIIEDYILNEFKEVGEDLSLQGEDRDRTILSNDKVSASSDYVYKYDGGEIKIELMIDYKGYWIKYGKLDLRDEKYNKLNRERALLLAVSIKSKTYYLLDFRCHVPAKYLECHAPYGDKPVYSIDLLNFTPREFIVEGLVSHIKNIL